MGNAWDEDRFRYECQIGTRRLERALIDAEYLAPRPMQEDNISITPEAPPTEDPRNATSLYQLLRSVAKKHLITVNQLKGDSRCREFVLARKELIFIAFHTLGISAKRIGTSINRDHTTVLYHLGRVARNDNPKFPASLATVNQRSVASASGAKHPLRGGALLDEKRFCLPDTTERKTRVRTSKGHKRTEGTT